MTKVFERFQEQYFSTGRKKADGYDKSHFDGLSEDEIKQVSEMLKKELGVNPDAAKWLFYIDPTGAEQVCLRYLENPKSEKSLARISVLYYLYKNDAAPRYQKAMIKAFDAIPDYQKKGALEYVGRTNGTVDLGTFLKRIILSESDETLLNPASFYFMAAHNIPATTEDEKRRYRKLLAELKDSYIRTRESAISTIESAFPFV